MFNTYLAPYNGTSYLARRGSSAVESLFDSLFDPVESALFNLMTSHASTFQERDGVYSTEVPLAGYKREEVSIEVSQDGFITITAENKKRGKLIKQLYLSDVDAEKIEAKLEDGYLSLNLPKHPEALPKKIEVK